MSDFGGTFTVTETVSSARSGFVAPEPVRSMFTVAGAAFHLRQVGYLAEDLQGVVFTRRERGHEHQARVEAADSVAQAVAVDMRDAAARSGLSHEQLMRLPGAGSLPVYGDDGVY